MCFYTVGRLGFWKRDVQAWFTRLPYVAPSYSKNIRCFWYIEMELRWDRKYKALDRTKSFVVFLLCKERAFLSQKLPVIPALVSSCIYLFLLNTFSYEIWKIFKKLFRRKSEEILGTRTVGSESFLFLIIREKRSKLFELKFQVVN